MLTCHLRVVLLCNGFSQLKLSLSSYVFAFFPTWSEFPASSSWSRALFLRFTVGSWIFSTSSNLPCFLYIDERLTMPSKVWEYNSHSSYFAISSTYTPSLSAFSSRSCSKYIEPKYSSLPVYWDRFRQHRLFISSMTCVVNSSASGNFPFFK